MLKDTYNFKEKKRKFECLPFKEKSKWYWNLLYEISYYDPSEIKFYFPVMSMRKDVLKKNYLTKQKNKINVHWVRNLKLWNVHIHLARSIWKFIQKKKNPKRKNNYVPKKSCYFTRKKMITKKTTTEKSPNNFSNLSRLK